MRLIPAHPLKLVRADLYFEGRAILFFFTAHFRSNCKFFRCTDNEDNNKIMLRSITRRYASSFHRVRIGFFPQHFQYFVRKFLSDASSNEIMRNKGTSDADACLSPCDAEKAISSEIQR